MTVKTHEAFIELNGVPTSVITWGRWIEEPAPANEEIVLCLPGNPGVPAYYRYFLETIHCILKCPVWILGHAGHVETEKNDVKIPPLNGNENLYDLQAQIEHKVQFFNKYIPKGTKIHIIGHSVGAYIILQLLKNPEIHSEIIGAYLLFPTLDNIGETPNGKLFTNVIKHILWLTYFGSWIFTIFPNFIQRTLIYFHSVLTKYDKVFIPVTVDFIKPSILKKVFFMAFNEFEIIKDLDIDLVKKNKDILKLYYAVDDGWAPVSFCKKIILENPDIQAEICHRNFDHAFVLRHSEKAGEMVANWIKNKQ